jgi:hypothetical protein
MPIRQPRATRHPAGIGQNGDFCKRRHHDAQVSHRFLDVVHPAAAPQTHADRGTVPNRSSATVARGAAGKDIKVPMLVLHGEWLAAIGFPIGAAAYLVSDAQGELALSRLGLRLPRRLKIHATPK